MQFSFHSPGDSGDSPTSRGEKQAPPPRPPPPPARLKSPERPRLPAGKKPQVSPPPKRPVAKHISAPPPLDSNLAASAASVVSARKAGAFAAFNDVRQREQQAIGSPAAGKPPFPPESNGGVAKPQPPAKPLVPRKISNVNDPGSNVVDNPVYGGFPQQQKDPPVNVTDLYSKVNKAAKAPAADPLKKVCFDQDQANIQRREAVRRPPDDRRKTVASFESEAEENGGGSEGVSVAMRTKLFDGQISGGKPTPPKKSEAVRSMSMRTSRDREQLTQIGPENTTNESEDIYEPPWDSGKSSAVLEKLKQSHQPPPRSATDSPSNMSAPDKAQHAPSGKPSAPGGKPPPLPSQPPPKVSPGGRRIIPDSINKSAPGISPAKPHHPVPANKGSPGKPLIPVNKDSPGKPPLVPANKDSSATSHPTGPPPKPPRTHAHDNYLMTKISKESDVRDHQQATRKKSLNAMEGQSGETADPSEDTEYISVKDRLAKLRQLQTTEPQPQVPASNSSPPLSSREPRDQESVTLRQRPPSRPPPPKHRPSSGDSSGSFSSSPRVSARPLTQCPEVKHSHSGPIIIPVFPRRQQQQQQQQLHVQHPRIAYQRQSSATHDSRRRKPTDDLPQEPDGGGLRPLGRFPLRKSFSSECLHSSRGSSLNLSTSGTWGDSSADTGDNFSVMSRSAQNYEAVIDPDGYAVPNEFVRLPQHRKDSQAEDQMVSVVRAQTPKVIMLGLLST